jgi:hypothetical protein
MEKVQFINVQIRYLDRVKSCLATKVMENLIGSQFTGKQRKEVQIKLSALANLNYTGTYIEPSKCFFKELAN